MAKPCEHQEVKTPKVFISYAQSDERTLRIPEICERLTHDGVEVVADLYEPTSCLTAGTFMRSWNDA